jgi:hypothetical protein
VYCFFKKVLNVGACGEDLHFKAKTWD